MVDGSDAIHGLATFKGTPSIRNARFSPSGDARGMAAMAEVLENQDLAKLIMRASTFDCVWLRDTILQQIRLTKVLRGVNKLFNRLAVEVLNAIMTHFRGRMDEFESVSAALGYALHDQDALANRTKLLEVAHWPAIVYDLVLGQVKPEEVGETYFALDQFKRRRDPQNCDELADLLERKCACCGTVCPWIAKDREKIPNYRPWFDNRSAFAAYGMHPYLGRRVVHQGLHVLQGTLIPFTHQDHFFEVAFVHELETNEFAMRLHVYASMTGDELRFSRFLAGACDKPWYEENIKRVFRMRDANLFCEERNRRRIVFLATICMFNPTFSDPTDWSVQSIFGLTGAEVMATVRRGSAIQRERRLLS